MPDPLSLGYVEHSAQRVKDSNTLLIQCPIWTNKADNLALIYVEVNIM